MSLEYEPGKIDPKTLRRLEVDRTVQRAMIGAGVAIALECGTGAFLIEENRPAIKNVFQLAKNRALQKVGVLDENFGVIPGQEEFAR